MRNWKFWLGLAISIIFMWWALNGLEWGDIWQAVRFANYWWLVPSVATYFVAVWVRTWRWDYMLRPLGHIPVKRLFPVVVIGYMGNNIYPFRAGELLRSYVLYRREEIPVSASLATVIVERVFDGLIMLLFVFLALPFFPLPENYRSLVILASVAFLGALIVFFALASMPRRALKLVGWGCRWLPDRWGEAIFDFAKRFLDGLLGLRNFRNVLMIFGTSLIIWLLETVKYWFVMHAFDFGEAQVSFFALMLMNGVVNLATTLPSAPGYVGTFDKPGIAVLMLYGVAGEIAAAYTLTLHVALWLPITALGGYYMVKEGMRWADFNRAARLNEQNAGVGL
ncbi:MAG: lysylphosphatidylglycerol synthase transmembrane domain-containing protein [Ardenticatenaceae bacterium]|nr:lysylphosphatidylglycerol synthase transmembrane domain-containing protein [Ardenticatenaceae bacterium]